MQLKPSLGTDQGYALKNQSLQLEQNRPKVRTELIIEVANHIFFFGLNHVVIVSMSIGVEKIYNVLV